MSEETVHLVALGALAVASGLICWGSIRLLWRERKARQARQLEAVRRRRAETGNGDRT